MKNKHYTSIAALATILTLSVIGLTSTGLSITANASETTDVNVTIASEVAVDVEPNILQYKNVSVGTQVNKTERSFSGITIENTGSEYIDRIWVNASEPENRPFGTGIPGNYDAGNFLQVKPQLNSLGVSGASVSEYHFVNRIEYEIPPSRVPTYIVAPENQVTLPNGQTVSAVGGDIKVGRFRRGDEHIWFIIATPDTANCEGGNSNPGAMIRVGDTSSTPSRLGTVDFTDDNSGAWTQYQIDTLSNTGTVGIAGSAVTLNFKNDSPKYDLLTHCDSSSSYVTRERFAVDYDGATDLQSNGYATQYILRSANTADTMLLPGGTIPLPVAIEVPTGVAEGNVELGQLRILATANTTAQR
ncbi:MAG: hypothetical protein ABEJ36_01445 [Candidatus Nanosalina sp.]